MSHHRFPSGRSCHPCCPCCRRHRIRPSPAIRSCRRISSTSYQCPRRPDCHDRCGRSSNHPGHRSSHSSQSPCSTPSSHCRSNCWSRVSSSCSLRRATSSTSPACCRYDATNRSCRHPGCSADQPSVCLLLLSRCVYAGAVHPHVPPVLPICFARRVPTHHETVEIPLTS
jgi:hypothetical protein